MLCVLKLCFGFHAVFDILYFLINLVPTVLFLCGLFLDSGIDHQALLKQFEHLNHNNPHTFEAKDLDMLIRAVSVEQIQYFHRCLFALFTVCFCSGTHFFSLLASVLNIFHTYLRSHSLRIPFGSVIKLCATGDSLVRLKKQCVHFSL